MGLLAGDRRDGFVFGSPGLNQASDVTGLAATETAVPTQVAFDFEVASGPWFTPQLRNWDVHGPRQCHLCAAESCRHSAGLAELLRTICRAQHPVELFLPVVVLG